MNILKKTLLAAGAAVALPGAAMADWYEAKTDQFIVYSAGSEDEAREFAALLEQFDRAMRSVQGMALEPKPSDSQRLTVYHWGKIADVGRLATGSRASGIAGFYIPNAGQPVAFSPIRDDPRRRAGTRRVAANTAQFDTLSVLKHEYTHSFMFQHFPATYPGWYSEGFAEVYGELKFNEDGSFRLGDVPQDRGSYFDANLGYHVRKLFETDRELTGLDRASWYTMGWLLTHYLTFGSERPGQLGDYLSRIQRGETSMAAAEAAFGDLNRLDSDIRAYLNRGNLPGIRVEPVHRGAPEVAVRKLTDTESEAVDAQMRVRAAFGDRKKEVGQELARDLVSEVPLAEMRSALTAVTLAEAAVAGENYVLASQAGSRALELDPDNAKALYWMGVAAAEQAEDGQGDWGTARTYLRRAAAADPYDPAPFYAYYETFLEEGVQPTEDAAAGLESAYLMAPYDGDLRLMTARMLAAEGEAQIAADLLTPLTFAVHGNDDAEALREAQQMLAEGKAEDGLTKIDELRAKQKKEEEEG